MRNRAFILVEIEIVTQHDTEREVARSFANYIMPQISGPMCIKGMKWVGVQEMHNEQGGIIPLKARS